MPVSCCFTGIGAWSTQLLPAAAVHVGSYLQVRCCQGPYLDPIPAAMTIPSLSRGAISRNLSKSSCFNAEICLKFKLHFDWYIPVIIVMFSMSSYAAAAAAATAVAAAAVRWRRERTMVCTWCFYNLATARLILLRYQRNYALAMLKPAVVRIAHMY